MTTTVAATIATETTTSHSNKDHSSYINRLLDACRRDRCFTHSWTFEKSEYCTYSEIWSRALIVESLWGVKLQENFLLVPYVLNNYCKSHSCINNTVIINHVATDKKGVKTLPQGVLLLLSTSNRRRVEEGHGGVRRHLFAKLPFPLLLQPWFLKPLVMEAACSTLPFFFCLSFCREGARLEQKGTKPKCRGGLYWIPLAFWAIN